MARLVTLIYTEDRRGLGKDEDDPIRLVPQLWTQDGVLVVEVDGYHKDRARFESENL